jgi:CheY-like chemotaxis protein
MFGSVQILIVDDSDVTRRIVSTIVRSRHWNVCGEAEDGWSAIRKFQELKPDVVLLDLAMPDINGIEVARMMSGLDPTVPIILLTIMDLEGLANAARRAGISAVVSKAQCWNLLKSIETAVAQSQRLIQ